MINGNHNSFKNSYKSISSLLKNKNLSNNLKNTINFYQIYNTFDKKKSLISKMKSNNSKYLLNSIVVHNKSKINSKSKQDIKSLKQSIGINTSKISEKNPFLSGKDKSFNISQKTKSKMNIEDLNTSSSLYKNYFVGYNKKGEFIDNVKIRELRRNLKTFSAYNYQTFRNLSSKFGDNKNKNNSLLTYNFNKDAYSNSQRLLLNISNNNYFKYEKDIKKNKLICKLKRQKTATINNYRIMAYPNINIKSMSNENNIKNKRKSFKYNNLFLSHDFKNSDNNYFDKKYMIQSEIGKNNINIMKVNKKKN